jgi:hypothetical protein
MENRAAHSSCEQGAGATERRIELRCAAIEVDGAALRRTAEFTDGSTRSVTLEWNKITRVVAVRCEEPHEGVCVLVTGGGVVVVLGEGMEGFRAMVESFPAHLGGAAEAAEWRARVTEPASQANVTGVFARAAEMIRGGDEFSR